MRRARGFGTLIGNGWLREPARPRPGLADYRGRSALRKCLFLEVPPEIRALGPVVMPAHAPPRPAPPRRPEPEIETRRTDPGKRVRAMAAFPNLVRAAAHVAPPPAHVAPVAASAWWEDPIAVGSLLILLPPVGLAALWTSKRYSSDARWALTVVTALMMCLATAATIAIAAIVS